jgi:hypothetical protein
MNASRIGHLLLTLVAGGLLWASATPAQAQLAAGCACPAGYTPISASACFKGLAAPQLPPICTFSAAYITHIIAAEQQQSFWGIKTMLQQKQDQLQSTPVPGRTGSHLSGYASSNLDDNADAIGYADQSKKNNPLASTLYDAAPSAEPANPVWGGWVQGLADTEHDDMLSATDTAHSTNTYTAQGGLDRTQQGVLSSDDALVVGVVSSWTDERTTFEGSATKLLLVGPGVGFYTEYVKGGFSSDVTTKFDFLNLTQDFAGVAPNVVIGILNAGVSGNMQYKFTGDNNNFLEPTAGFSLTHTGFGSGATALGLEDAYTVRIQTGARVGTTWDVGNGVTIDGSFKALVYGDAISQGTSASGVGTLTAAITPSDEGLVRGELDPEICFNLPDNYSVTVSGQYRFGRALSGGSAGVNLRKQW